MPHSDLWTYHGQQSREGNGLRCNRTGCRFNAQAGFDNDVVRICECPVPVEMDENGKCTNFSPKDDISCEEVSKYSIFL